MPPDADVFDAAFNAAVAQFSAAPGSSPAGATPFTALGHDRGRFFFYTCEGRQVISLSARDLHSAGELPKLAPLRWWEAAYPGKESFSVKAAGDALIRACYGAGVFDPDRQRGRGVWIDDGRVVLHLGDRLVIDGKAVPIADARSDYLYEQARPLRLEIDRPLSDDEGRALLRACCGVAWENPDRDGRLLAGWIMVALVCGAMAWRPHLWLVSEAGGGKSWVLDNIVKPLLRGLALQVQSKTSEAGIRGDLGSDARPVIFDEAETQNEADRARMQHVLDLARQASSEDGGAIVKGTREGGSRSYRIRSCFVWASVNLGLTQAADESRTLVLTIGPGTPDQFAALKADHADAFTPGIAGRLLARALRLIPTMRANADLLADAIARTGAGRRAGDTLGTVLAGTLALTSDRLLTAAEADRAVAGQAWITAAADAARPQPEWQRALMRLMQHQVRYTTRNGRAETASVSELLGALEGVFGDDSISPTDADTALRRLGVMLHGTSEVAIGNRAEGVAGAFRGSPWEAAWLATLGRAPGARRSVPVRFTRHYQDRAVVIPLSALEGDAP